MWKGDGALLTDLYQLNMLAAYLDHGLTETAVFELFVRKLPLHRGFLMTAGLDQALQFLETLSFTPDELDAIRSLAQFPASFMAWLRSFRFTGDVDAMPEGTVFFPDEPILRVTAPLPAAQFVETRLVNLLHFQTVVASKAARMVLAAPEKTLIDYGLRRAHGAEAGVLAARASYIAGFSGTATVAAGIAFGIPVYGTMAHSFVQAHDDEVLAFEHFAGSHPQGLVLLIDTYDTERAAGRVVDWHHDWQRKELRSPVCVSTAATSASMPQEFAGSSTSVGCSRSRSLPAAASTRIRCWNCRTPVRRSIPMVSVPA